MKDNSLLFSGSWKTPFLNVAGSDTIHYSPISENIYRFAPVHV